VAEWRGSDGGAAATGTETTTRGGGGEEEQQRQQQGETADAPSDIAVAVLRRASAGEQGTASSSPLEFDVEVEVALVRALVREHDRWIAQA